MERQTFFLPFLEHGSKCCRIFLLLINFWLCSVLFGQTTTGISVKEEDSDCGQCNGKLTVKLPLDVVFPLEIVVVDAKKNTQKLAVKSANDVTKDFVFNNMCPGPYNLLITTTDPRFAALECGKREHQGGIKGKGDGIFAIDFDNNFNGGIAIKTDAIEPKFQWNTGKTTQNLTNINPGNYWVTVTDISGCKKSAGPFTTNQSCYDSEGKYIAEKFDIWISEVQVGQLGFMHTGKSSYDFQVWRVNGTGFPAGHTIKWFNAAGNLLGQGASFNLFASHRSLQVLVATACESREQTIRPDIFF